MIANTDCKNIQELIPLYLDNMLSDEENDTVRTHIETCDVCKAEYELMASIMQTAASLPEIDVPEGFHEKLMEKVKAEAEAKKERKAFALPWKKVSGFAAAAAVIAVSVVSFMQLDRENNQTNPDMYLEKSAPVSTPAPQKTAEDVIPEESASVQTEIPSATAKPSQQATSSVAPTAETVTQTPTTANKTAPAAAEKSDGAQHVPQAVAEDRAEPAEPAAEAVAEFAPETTTKPSAAPKTAATPKEAEKSAKPNSSSGGSKASAGGGGGGGAARPQTQYRIVTVTVADTAKAQAKEILSAYAKDANGYKVGSGIDAVLAKLSGLEGYQVSTKTSADVSANYIVLR